MAFRPVQFVGKRLTRGQEDISHKRRVIHGHAYAAYNPVLQDWKIVLVHQRWLLPYRERAEPINAVTDFCQRPYHDIIRVPPSRF